MKTFHVHIRVKDLQESTNFYTALFGRQPSVKKPDYAKWMLEDPKINFAISNGHAENGIEHLGIQTESREELQEVYKNFENAIGEIFEEGDCSCCYSKSEKSWITDPQGVDWEAFFTYGETTVYGEGRNTKKSPESMENWKKDETISECDGSCHV
ncbi:glyoxalase/bleomycin resistance/dioxygenase family protein [Gramella sp. BOM4]|nr:glyoxalase/bleomycin resistance/dioxygenase family protein [Christiangramia bathymodioli]